jgi:hypothetical protein
MIRSRESLFALLLAAIWLPRLLGEPASGLELIKLHNGINEIDLDGTGQRATVVLAHRENFNAHSFEVTTIYVRARLEKGAPGQWQIVHREHRGENEAGDLALLTSGGADCVLHDFRLLRDGAHRSAALIVADREPGESFADAEPVTFTFYKLARNTDEEIGRGLVYFKYEREMKSKTPYCDVEKAFQAELGIGMDKKGMARD